ncbi:VOC family protein [Streptomyces sp. WMMC897]|uniref:VOC family protein n=1 Tax=Streptomyces sp. WMMC897 TaxID=3014782 RepID=UPI0022B752E6|nr:VOC family protein [Streptomyces sp. WMMC897]MCZ7413572.1 hypothetical protein [Streptomyces sp. WMMC897]
MAAQTAPPSVFPTLLYADAKAAIAQMQAAFGFTEDMVYAADDGSVLHAELSYGNGTVMLGSKGGEGAFAEATRDAGPTTVYVVVEDCDAHHRRAAENGAEILSPPVDQSYGSRDYIARDLEGNVWVFGTYSPDRAAG